MGAVMRRIEVAGTEIHESTGKLAPGGERHEPLWSQWWNEPPIGRMRRCDHPDCDLDDYEAWHDSEGT